MLIENTGINNLTQASIYSRMSDSPVDDKRLRAKLIVQQDKRNAVLHNCRGEKHRTLDQP